MQNKYNIVDIIEKKIKGKELEENEIRYVISAYVKEELPDYQMAALLTAIKINGMTETETLILTDEMVKSGEIVDLSDIKGIIFDKHSTGGVGDKVTLVIIPILASLGYKVAKMSGRGLGYTGGTVDKLESIPGFKIALSLEEFKNNIKKVGASIMSQTDKVVPADGKIYKLRSSIACTDSIPLITSSIMSKKIASGAENIILDVTYGSGAFMKSLGKATELKKLMEKIGKLSNVNIISRLTSMEEPLGYCIGNSLEVLEAMAFLNGEKIDSLQEVVFELLIEAIKEKEPQKDRRIIKRDIIEVIENKKAYYKFVEMLENQGADLNKFKEEVYKNSQQENKYTVYSKKTGFITNIDALSIAKASFKAGSGRINKEDEIDYYSGIALNKRSGDIVNEGDVLGYIFIGNKTLEKLDQDEINGNIVQEKYIQDIENEILNGINILK